MVPVEAASWSCSPPHHHLKKIGRPYPSSMDCACGNSRRGGNCQNPSCSLLHAQKCLGTRKGNSASRQSAKTVFSFFFWVQLQNCFQVTSFYLLVLISSKHCAGTFLHISKLSPAKRNCSGGGGGGERRNCMHIWGHLCLNVFLSLPHPPLC